MGNLNLKFSNSNKYLIVSGSNISLLNGIYVESGTVSAKPKYVKTPAVNYLGFGNFEIYIEGELPIVWAIRTVNYNGYFYYGNSSYASPDLVPAWNIGQNGSGNISIKVTGIGKTSIKRKNTGGGRIIAPKPINLFTCPFEVDTDTCPGNGGMSNPGWIRGPNTSRIGKTTAPDGSNTAVEYQSELTSDSFVCQGFLQYWRPYTKYKFSIWAKSTLGVATDGQVVNVTKNGGADRVSLGAVGNLTSTWQKFTITFTTGPSMNSYITAFFGGDLTAGTRIALWGAEMYRYN